MEPCILESCFTDLCGRYCFHHRHLFILFFFTSFFGPVYIMMAGPSVFTAKEIPLNYGISTFLRISKI